MKHDDWQFLDVRVWKHQEKLEKLLKLSEERTEELAALCLSYEEKTDPDPTPAEEARLERIQKVWNRSQEQTDRLWLRLAATKKMASAHEEELILREQGRITKNRYSMT